jgi:hypothetical protein
MMGLKKAFKNVKDKKWFQSIQKIAPKLAAGLSGPFGWLAEDVLEEVLGKPAVDIEGELATGNPETFLKFKEAEQRFDERMREFDIEEQDLYLKDVQSARDMHKANKDYVPAVLTFLAILLFGFMSYAILFDVSILTEGNEKFVFYLLSTGNSLVIMGYSFYLGSSKGSQRKTDILANGGSK